jgi:hypothetical protein
MSPSSLCRQLNAIRKDPLKVKRLNEKKASNQCGVEKLIGAFNLF